MYSVKPDFTRKDLPGKIVQKIRRTLRNMKRDRIRNQVLAMLSPQPSAKGDIIEVSTLLCAKDFQMGIIAAYYNVKFAGRPIRMRFFEDGSLTASHWKQLETLFPGHDMFPRPMVDELVFNAFGKDSRIIRTRAINPMFHKLVDVNFLNKKERVTYTDPDILFFKAPTEMLDIAVSGSEVNYFNKDMDSAYIFPREELNQMVGREVPERMNAGLFCLHRNAINFETLEWALGQKPFVDFWKFWRVEQTLFAFLSSHNGQEAKWLPAGYDVDFYKKPLESPCKHYVGWIRHGFELEGLAYILERDTP